MMEKIYVCQFEEQNMDSEEFDPKDYCGYEHSCEFKRTINGKKLCMKQPEDEMVDTILAASMTFSMHTVQDAALLVKMVAEAASEERLQLRSKDYIATIHAYSGGVTVTRNGVVPTVIRNALKDAF